jgi:hypothetical protein
MTCAAILPETISFVSLTITFLGYVFTQFPLSLSLSYARAHSHSRKLYLEMDHSLYPFRSVVDFIGTQIRIAGKCECEP